MEPPDFPEPEAPPEGVGFPAAPFEPGPEDDDANEEVPPVPATTTLYVSAATVLVNKLTFPPPPPPEACDDALPPFLARIRKISLAFLSVV